MRTSLAHRAAYRLRYHQGRLSPGMTDAQHPLKPPAWAKHFPPSTAQPSHIFNFTGTTVKATETVRKVLTENDRGYDIWENPPRRCAYTLPASIPLLQVARMGPWAQGRY